MLLALLPVVVALEEEVLDNDNGELAEFAAASAVDGDVDSDADSLADVGLGPLV